MPTKPAFLASLVICVSAQACMAGQATEGLRPITMRDIVEFTALGSRPAVVGEKGREMDVDVRSPDGKLTAVITRQGNIARNSNVYTLWLYRTAELMKGPRATRLLRWESTSNRSAVCSLQWLGDSRTLAFLGERPGELPQVYTVRVDSGNIAQRTAAKTVIQGFAIAADDSWLIYEAQLPRDDPEVERKRRRGFAVTPETYLGDLFAGDWSGLPFAGSETATDLIVVRAGEAPRKYRHPLQTVGRVFPRISADGARAWFRVRQPGDELYVELSLKSGEQRRVSKQERDSAVTDIPSVTQGPKLTLSYSPDRPTRLIAVDKKRRAVVLDTAAQIAHLRLASVKPLKGPLPNGRQWSGGLYLPPDAVPGKRYPLVIQTHGFDPEFFAPYGFAPAANAAQPLAARGVAVLQFDEISVMPLSEFGTPRELPGIMAGYEAAVKQLDELGYIDTARIGIQGWSRTGQYVYYTLQNSKLSFAAAFVSDAQTGGYFEKIAMQNVYPGYRTESANLFGAQPQGEGLRAWAQHSPGFNMDKIDVPIRLESYGLESVLFMWEPYIRLTEIGKPVEFFIFPEAVHNLVKPLERLASAEAMEDWFVFWLTGARDPAPEKSAQYQRWEDLSNSTAASGGVE